MANLYAKFERTLIYLTYCVLHHQETVESQANKSNLLDTYTVSRKSELWTKLPLLK